MLLGIAFVVFDLFSVRLFKKIFPDQNYWNEENWPNLDAQQRRDFTTRRRLYESILSHRFRSWGIILFLVGALLLATSAILK